MTITTPAEVRITWLRGEMSRMRQGVKTFRGDRARRADCARTWLRYRRALRFYLHQQELERQQAMTPRQLLDARRANVITPAEYSAAMTALAERRGLRGPEAE